MYICSSYDVYVLLLNMRRLLNAWRIYIDGKDISLIRNLYWHQKAYMRTEDGLSPEIHIKIGVRQDCVLSPCLFNLYTENIFGAINTNKGIKIGGTTINNLR